MAISMRPPLVDGRFPVGIAFVFDEAHAACFS
jgi:hypothetical protein